MEIYESLSNETGLFIKTTDILFPDTPKQQILIYDIDTTSFEAANGCIFMIGVMFFKDENLCVRHYFSEKIPEESIIIEKFIELAEGFRYLLSYKGESFDIPFIGKRLYELQKYTDAAEKLKSLYTRLQSIRSRSVDVFNEINPIKSHLGFSSTKLDYLRGKLGQKVPERISGENISKFYVEHIAACKLKKLQEISRAEGNVGFIAEYEPKPVLDELAHINPNSGDRFLKDVLLRNRENMEAVLYIMKLSHLFAMRRGEFSTEIKACFSNISVMIRERDFSLELPLKTMRLDLKQFYMNYKDYYYFPAEDMAVHKSLAEFADSSSKKKATIKTAYRRVSGEFVHIPRSFALSENNKASNRYKADYEAEEYYLPVEELKRLDNERLKELSFYLTLDYISKNMSIIENDQLCSKIDS